MSTLAVVAVTDLSSDFDLGIITPSKITLKPAWSRIQGKPTTVATSGLTDAVTTAALAAAIAPLTGAMVYQGAWNAATNTPALDSGVGNKGWLYTVSTPGTTAIDGISQWNAGDDIVFNGTVWQKLDGISNEVASVAGRTGAIVLAMADVTDAATVMQTTITTAATVTLTNSFGTVIGHALP